MRATPREKTPYRPPRWSKPLVQAVHLALLSLTLPLAQAQSTKERQPARAPDAAQVLDTLQITSQYVDYVQKQSSAATGLDLELKETPQSVTVITRERIRDQQIQTIREAMEQVNGLTIQNYDDNRSDIVARGFKVENYQLDGNLLVSDNTPPSLNLSAMYERIEVTKGATGLLVRHRRPLGHGESGAQTRRQQRLQCRAGRQSGFLERPWL